MTPDQFIAKWKVAQGREDSNSNPFLSDLCRAFDLPTPGPWTGDFDQSPYIFEFPVNVIDSDGKNSSKKIDLYRRDCFILEAKQATDEDPQADNLELSSSRSRPKSRPKKAAVTAKLKCLDTHSFPDASKEQKQKIREIAERLDAHRKRQQSLHPGLTMTEMYNALEALRSDTNLHETDAKGKKIHAKLLKSHDDGLVSILKKLYDDLDAAVVEAYGWPADLAEPEILQRLVNLNTTRHQEEQSGLIRWLRPEYQCQ